jgi:hypothetical protein
MMSHLDVVVGLNKLRLICKQDLVQELGWAFLRSFHFWLRKNV